MAGQKREARLYTRIPAIHVFAALDQVVDTRVKPGHDESWTVSRNDRRNTGEPPYSAGFGSGGGGVADGGAVAAVAAAAFFSTMRTAMIEPSYSNNSGIASEDWLSTSGGVRTAAMMKATTMK